MTVITKAEQISRLNADLLKYKDEVKDLIAKVVMYKKEAELKEELRKKWYDQLQQSEANLEVEKKQSAFLQKRVTELEQILGIKKDGIYHLKQAIKKWLKL